MGNQYLALGMFIMLLSFFIVLNAMSGFDKGKTQAVMESLSETLSVSTKTKQNMYATSIAEEGKHFNQGDNLDQIQALFRSTIPDVVARRNRFGNRLTLSMPQDEFEFILLSIGSDEESTRFVTMLAMLMNSEEDIPYKMDMIIRTKSYKSSINHIVKSGQYAQILETSGVPAFLMSSGLQQGQTNTIDLVFSHYEPMKLELRS